MRYFATASQSLSTPDISSPWHRHSLPLPSWSTRLNATAFRCYAKASLGYALPMPRTAYHCHRSSFHVIAFAKLNKTTLRSTIADLCSSFADRCTTLPVNAMPMQIRSTLFPRDSRLCHASAKLCVAITVQSHAAAVHSLATAMQILAFADQHLSLPPLCAAMPIEA